MLNDRTILIYLTPILFIVFFLYMMPVILTSWLLISTERLILDEPALLESILESYVEFEGLPNSVTNIVVQSLPALVGAICFRRLSNAKISLAAHVLFYALLLGCLASILSLFFLNPNDEIQSHNAIIGSSGLERLHNDCEASLRTATTYILLFVGSQVPIQPAPKRP